MTQRQELSVVALCGVGAIILLILLVLQGCGSWQTTTGKALAGVHDVAKGASAVVEPHYRAKCMAVALACTSKPCDALEACQLERRRINSAIKAMHRAVRAMTEVLPLIDDARKAVGK